MLRRDFEKAKVISTGTVGCQKAATMEVSSYEALFDYSWTNFNRVTHVRISESCRPDELESIIGVCKHQVGLIYESDDNNDGDDEKEGGEKKGAKKKDEKKGNKEKDEEGEKKCDKEDEKKGHKEEVDPTEE